MKRKAPHVTWRKHSKVRRYVNAAVGAATGYLSGGYSGAARGAIAGWKVPKNTYKQAMYRSNGSPVRVKGWIGSAPATPTGSAGGSTLVGTPSKAPPVKQEVFKGDKVGMSIRKVTDIYLGRKMKMKTLANFQYAHNTQTVISGVTGEQMVDTSEVVFTRDVLLGNTDSSRSVTTKIDVDLYRLNPFWSNPAPLGGIYAPGTGIAAQDKIYCRYVDVTYRIVSMKATPQEIRLFLFTPKFDCDTTPIQDWNTILTDKGLGQVAQTVASNMGTATATGGTPTRVNPGQTPIQHAEFRRRWTQLKDVKMLLQSGEQINFRFRIYFNRVISRESITARDSQYLKNLTIYPMWTAMSGLIGIRATTSSEAAEVTFGSTKIGIVTNHQYKFGALPVSRLSTARVYQGYLSNATQNKATLNDEEVVIDPEAVTNEV